MPDDTPTDHVLLMKQQGLSNNQIVTALQRQGYNTNQILDAMNQADLRLQTNRPFDQGAPVGSPQQSDAPQFEETVTTQRIEELAEAIIDEKWNDLMENINRIIDWKEKTDSRLTEIETTMRLVKDDFDKIHSAVLERVGDYDKHISEVGTEVKALEKVFQKVLPGFIENMGELSRITEELKKQTR
jgi:uncharacterized protein YukE